MQRFGACTNDTSDDAGVARMLGLRIADAMFTETR